MNQDVDQSIAIVSLLYTFILIGCVLNQSNVEIVNGLPNSHLKPYNDSFKTIRWDMWEKAGYLYSDLQAERFKSAEMFIEDSKLVIKTKTNCFSKGGLASTFALRGDFDIQIDCRVNFVEGPVEWDQIIAFGVIEKDVGVDQLKAVQIGLVQKEKYSQSYVWSNHRYNKKWRGRWGEQVGDFSGKLRIIRLGDQVTTFYRKLYSNDWVELSEYPFTTKDAFVGFRVQNFTASAKKSPADETLITIFDNFQINGAQGIIEADI